MELRFLRQHIIIILIWDRDTQELLHTCTGHIHEAKVLCANDQYIFSGGEEISLDVGIVLPVNPDMFLKDILAPSPLSPSLEIIS